MCIRDRAWSWEFLTEVVGLDPDRLYPSVYEDDDEAFEIWNQEIGIPAERIFRFGKEEDVYKRQAYQFGLSNKGSSSGKSPEIRSIAPEGMALSFIKARASSAVQM